MRAYGGTARDCLRQAARKFVKRKAGLQLEVDYSSLGAVHSLLEKYGAIRLDEQYGASGGITITIAVAEEVSSAFAAAVSDATSGRTRATPFTL